MANKKLREKGSGSLYKRGKVYQYRYYVDGKRIQVSTGCTNKDDAESWVNKHHGAVSEIKKTTDFYTKIAETKKLINKEKLTPKAALDKFTEKLKHEEILPDTANRHIYRVNKLINYLSTQHPQIEHIGEINDDIALEYINNLSKENLAEKTFNSEVLSLRKFMSYFQKEIGFTQNPFRAKKKNPEHIKLKKLNTVKKEGFTEQQTEQILKSLDNFEIRDREEYKMLFLLSSFTGARLKDCCLMKWKSIDYKMNLIRYKPYKTRNKNSKLEAQVPIFPELKQELLSFPKVSEYVLPNIAERYLKNRKYVCTDTKKILVHNGIETIQQNVEYKRKNKSVKFGFHSLRYYFCTQCARKRVPLQMVKEAVGHAEDLMTEYYTIISNPDRQKAFGLLGNSSIIEQITELLPQAKAETLKEILGLLKLDSDLIKRADKTTTTQLKATVLIGNEVANG